MPRNVRNFYLEGFVNGRQSPISGGPRSLSDGMRFTLYQREKGSISDGKIEVYSQVHMGCVQRDGTEKTELVTFIELPPGTTVRQNVDGSYTAIFRTIQ